MEVFETCREINNSLTVGEEAEAREKLIRLLDYHDKEGVEYSPLVNHMIRQTGLYPYMDTSTAEWSDRFVYEAFKSNIGIDEPVTLHREQAAILKRLLTGKSLAISAPTSFGKSFIIDAYIALKNPTNVVIIVPTIALTDETRRRLHQKFSDRYKIITTSDAALAEKNIMIFPQERVFNYVDKLEAIDILIIDEFYKASPSFEKDRSKALLRAILKLSKKATQRYFLAPNISSINENPFTKGMEFLRLNFNTVCLNVAPLYERYSDLKGDEFIEKKAHFLVKIIETKGRKTLIYAGSHPQIARVSRLLLSKLPNAQSNLLQSFSKWLAKNYSPNWSMTQLVRKGVGVHTGQLHRSLSQIQVKLFDEEQGIKYLVSTSSIIEGVNTCAEDVVIWHNKSGTFKLNDFTYKNIIGRGGRMFRHFVGNIYLLAPPPESQDTQLDLFVPEAMLLDVDVEALRSSLTQDQLANIFLKKDSLSELLGEENFEKLQRESAFQNSDIDDVRRIAQELKFNSSSWNGLGYLNSGNPEEWESMLYKVIKLQPSGWEIEYNRFVTFVKALIYNWELSIPEMLVRLKPARIGLEDFFKLERNVSFKLAALLSDVNTVQKHVWPEKGIDISPFITKVAHAFLPTVVYQLEEYGLPRMLSRKIHNAGIVDLENRDLTLHAALDKLSSFGVERLVGSIDDLDAFDIYVLRYFFQGISKTGSSLLSS